MSMKNVSALCVLAFSVAALRAQAPPPTPTPQAQRGSPDVVAGIPVNYDESKVGTYTLVDPLVLNDGKPVRDAKTWFAKRRPEIVEMFETKKPPLEIGVTVEIVGFIEAANRSANNHGTGEKVEGL